MQDVTRVFLNLFGNGFYAANKRRLAGAGAGYRPTLTVSTRDLGEAVEVRVRETTAIGILAGSCATSYSSRFLPPSPPEKARVLGSRSVTTSSRKQHGGSIEVESEPESFTEFTVRLHTAPARGLIEGEI